MKYTLDGKMSKYLLVSHHKESSPHTHPPAFPSSQHCSLSLAVLVSVVFVVFVVVVVVVVFVVDAVDEAVSVAVAWISWVVVSVPAWGACSRC